MEIEVAVAKVGKWATSESGDTLEMIERPQGGLSFVLVDGQRSGRAAKAISNLVARKAISELAEGIRSGPRSPRLSLYLQRRQGLSHAQYPLGRLDFRHTGAFAQQPLPHHRHNARKQATVTRRAVRTGRGATQH